MARSARQSAELSLIAAVDEGCAIGYKNSLPWPKISADMKLFRKYTAGKVLIMGRRTWESLPRVLPKRKHFIVSRTLQDSRAVCFDSLKQEPQPVMVFRDIDVLMEYVERWMLDGCVIGGAQLYKAFMEKGYVREMMITRIHGIHTADVLWDPSEYLEKGFVESDVPEAYKEDAAQLAKLGHHLVVYRR
jgi:dihydrofolate reductase